MNPEELDTIDPERYSDVLRTPRPSAMEIGMLAGRTRDLRAPLVHLLFAAGYQRGDADAPLPDLQELVIDWGEPPLGAEARS